MTSPESVLPRRCLSPKANGEPCGQTMNLGPDGMCLWHSPLRSEEAAAARLKGAEGNRKKEIRTATPDQLPGGPPDSIEEVCRWASWVAWAVASGMLDPRTAKECCFALGHLRQGLEKRDIARELSEVRAQLKELRARRDAA